jgi:PLP dependent protein
MSKEKLLEINSKLGRAKLLIVSKTRSCEEIQAYYDLGHRDFGENRVQELLEKSKTLLPSCPEIRWHMIGHLQKNKVNQLLSVPHLSFIHSVHDRELLDLLIEKVKFPLNIFLQFNASREDEKSGFMTYHELMTATEDVQDHEFLKLAGLMTMGTLRTEFFEAEARRCFQELQVEKEKLQSEFKMTLETSMGMSQDYEIALEEGSDWIRLGTMMFQ